MALPPLSHQILYVGLTLLKQIIDIFMRLEHRLFIFCELICLVIESLRRGFAEGFRMIDIREERVGSYCTWITCVCMHLCIHL